MQDTIFKIVLISVFVRKKTATQMRRPKALIVSCLTSSKRRVSYMATSSTENKINCTSCYILIINYL